MLLFFLPGSPDQPKAVLSPESSDSQRRNEESCSSGWKKTTRRKRPGAQGASHLACPGMEDGLAMASLATLCPLYRLLQLGCLDDVYAFHYGVSLFGARTGFSDAHRQSEVTRVATCPGQCPGGRGRYPLPRPSSSSLPTSVTRQTCEEVPSLLAQCCCLAALVIARASSPTHVGQWSRWALWTLVNSFAVGYHPVPTHGCNSTAARPVSCSVSIASSSPPPGAPGPRMSTALTRLGCGSCRPSVARWLERSIIEPVIGRCEFRVQSCMS